MTNHERTPQVNTTFCALKIWKNRKWYHQNPDTGWLRFAEEPKRQWEKICAENIVRYEAKYVSKTRRNFFCARARSVEARVEILRVDVHARPHSYAAVQPNARAITDGLRREGL